MGFSPVADPFPALVLLTDSSVNGHMTVLVKHGPSAREKGCGELESQLFPVRFLLAHVLSNKARGVRV